ncbi:MAG TPA: hypothetical protein VHC41_08120, partial [Mycobacteriales bacterium]|nr:hypothetical protein [Mycobacteriales bacterium]
TGLRGSLVAAIDAAGLDVPAPAGPSALLSGRVSAVTMTAFEGGLAIGAPELPAQGLFTITVGGNPGLPAEAAASAADRMLDGAERWTGDAVRVLWAADSEWSRPQQNEFEERLARQLSATITREVMPTPPRPGASQRERSQSAEAVHRSPWDRAPSEDPAPDGRVQPIDPAVLSGIRHAVLARFAGHVLEVEAHAIPNGEIAVRLTYGQGNPDLWLIAGNHRSLGDSPLFTALREGRQVEPRELADPRGDGLLRLQVPRFDPDAMAIIADQLFAVVENRIAANELAPAARLVQDWPLHADEAVRRRLEEQLQYWHGPEVRVEVTANGLSIRGRDRFGEYQVPVRLRQGTRQPTLELTVPGEPHTHRLGVPVGSEPSGIVDSFATVVSYRALVFGAEGTSPEATAGPEARADADVRQAAADVGMLEMARQLGQGHDPARVRDELSAARIRHVEHLRRRQVIRAEADRTRRMAVDDLRARSAVDRGAAFDVPAAEPWDGTEPAAASPAAHLQYAVARQEELWMRTILAASAKAQGPAFAQAEEDARRALHFLRGQVRPAVQQYIDAAAAQDDVLAAATALMVVSERIRSFNEVVWSVLDADEAGVFKDLLPDQVGRLHQTDDDLAATAVMADGRLLLPDPANPEALRNPVGPLLHDPLGANYGGVFRLATDRTSGSERYSFDTQVLVVGLYRTLLAAKGRAGARLDDEVIGYARFLSTAPVDPDFVDSKLVKVFGHGLYHTIEMNRSAAEFPQTADFPRNLARLREFYGERLQLDDTGPMVQAHVAVLAALPDAVHQLLMQGFARRDGSLHLGTGYARYIGGLAKDIFASLHRDYGNGQTLADTRGYTEHGTTRVTVGGTGSAAFGPDGELDGPSMVVFGTEMTSATDNLLRISVHEIAHLIGHFIGPVGSLTDGTVEWAALHDRVIRLPGLRLSPYSVGRTNDESRQEVFADLLADYLADLVSRQVEGHQDWPALSWSLGADRPAVTPAVELWDDTLIVRPGGAGSLGPVVRVERDGAPVLDLAGAELPDGVTVSADGLEISFTDESGRVTSILRDPATGSRIVRALDGTTTILTTEGQLEVYQHDELVVAVDAGRSVLPVADPANPFLLEGTRFQPMPGGGYYATSADGMVQIKADGLATVVTSTANRMSTGAGAEAALGELVEYFAGRLEAQVVDPQAYEQWNDRVRTWHGQTPLSHLQVWLDGPEAVPGFAERAGFDRTVSDALRWRWESVLGRLAGARSVVPYVEVLVEAHDVIEQINALLDQWVQAVRAEPAATRFAAGQVISEARRKTAWRMLSAPLSMAMLDRQEYDGQLPSRVLLSAALRVRGVSDVDPETVLEPVRNAWTRGDALRQILTARGAPVSLEDSEQAVPLPAGLSAAPSETITLRNVGWRTPRGNLDGLSAQPIDPSGRDVVEPSELVLSLSVPEGTSDVVTPAELRDAVSPQRFDLGGDMVMGGLLEDVGDVIGAWEMGHPGTTRWLMTVEVDPALSAVRMRMPRFRLVDGQWRADAPMALVLPGLPVVEAERDRFLGEVLRAIGQVAGHVERLLGVAGPVDVRPGLPTTRQVDVSAVTTLQGLFAPTGGAPAEAAKIEEWGRRALTELGEVAHRLAADPADSRVVARGVELVQLVEDLAAACGDLTGRPGSLFDPAVLAGLRPALGWGRVDAIGYFLHRYLQPNGDYPQYQRQVAALPVGSSLLRVLGESGYAEGLLRDAHTRHSARAMIIGFARSAGTSAPADTNTRFSRDVPEADPEMAADAVRTLWDRLNESDREWLVRFQDHDQDVNRHLVHLARWQGAPTTLPVVPEGTAEHDRTDVIAENALRIARDAPLSDEPRTFLRSMKISAAQFAHLVRLGADPMAAVRDGMFREGSVVSFPTLNDATADAAPAELFGDTDGVPVSMRVTTRHWLPLHAFGTRNEVLLAPELLRVLESRVVTGEDGQRRVIVDLVGESAWTDAESVAPSTSDSAPPADRAEMAVIEDAIRARFAGTAVLVNAYRIVDGQVMVRLDHPGRTAPVWLAASTDPAIPEWLYFKAAREHRALLPSDLVQPDETGIYQLRIPGTYRIGRLSAPIIADSLYAAVQTLVSAGQIANVGEPLPEFVPQLTEEQRRRLQRTIELRLNAAVRRVEVSATPAALTVVITDSRGSYRIPVTYQRGLRTPSVSLLSFDDHDTHPVQVPALGEPDLTGIAESVAAVVFYRAVVMGGDSLPPVLPPQATTASVYTEPIARDPYVVRALAAARLGRTMTMEPRAPWLGMPAAEGTIAWHLQHSVALTEDDWARTIASAEAIGSPSSQRAAANARLALAILQDEIRPLVQRYTDIAVTRRVEPAQQALSALSDAIRSYSAFVRLMLSQDPDGAFHDVLPNQPLPGDAGPGAVFLAGGGIWAPRLDNPGLLRDPVMPTLFDPLGVEYGSTAVLTTYQIADGRRYYSFEAQTLLLGVYQATQATAGLTGAALALKVASYAASLLAAPARAELAGRTIVDALGADSYAGEDSALHGLLGGQLSRIPAVGDLDLVRQARNQLNRAETRLSEALASGDATEMAAARMAVNVARFEVSTLEEALAPAEPVDAPAPAGAQLSGSSVELLRGVVESIPEGGEGRRLLDTFLENYARNIEGVDIVESVVSASWLLDSGAQTMHWHNTEVDPGHPRLQPLTEEWAHTIRLRLEDGYFDLDSQIQLAAYYRMRLKLEGRTGEALENGVTAYVAYLQSTPADPARDGQPIAEALPGYPYRTIQEAYSGSQTEEPDDVRETLAWLGAYYPGRLFVDGMYEATVDQVRQLATVPDEVHWVIAHQLAITGTALHLGPAPYVGAPPRDA